MSAIAEPMPGFLTGGGEMGARIRATDWESHPLGCPRRWPPALQVALGICLHSGIATAIYWGPELTLLYNDAWSPIPAEKHPAALGKPASQVWPDIWHVVEPQMMSVLSTGEGFSTRDQMLPMVRDGKVHETYWNYTFTPIRDESGAVVGIFNQGQETTDRVMTERTLQAAEDRLDLALEAAQGIGTWDWDVPGDLVTANANFARLYGVDPLTAADGAPLSEFFKNIHHDDLAQVQADIGKAIETGELFSCEYRLIQPDGSVRWVIAQGRASYAPDGTCLRLPGVTFDITERKQVEAALRESEERFRGITDSIDQMIWSTRPDGYHDYYNQRWYDFTGVPQGSTDGEEWNGMFHPDDQERAWSVWRNCLETGEPYHIEYRLRHRSGNYRWVLGRAQPVRDEFGRITRWFGTCTDIQDIVEAREILARSREELETEVKRRTEALMSAEQQLRQAQKMEAVGQLTGGIAHDFNNMLAVVIGGLNLLERRLARGDTDVGRYIHAAKDGANRAAALTQRLLAFSRRQPLAPERLDVNALVSGMEELLSRSLGEHVIIETRLEQTIWPADADPVQLENAILNLAVNARDAMPEGGRLTISTSNVAITDALATRGDLPRGDYVLISVTDTGIGMTREVLAQAFDPFFTTKEVGKGTGLGLSQVFGFVRQTGGQIHINSQPGQGTTVLIYLPRSSGRDPSVRTIPPIADARSGNPGEVILVVEDEERVLNFAVEALRELGYTVVHASSGADALGMIRAGQTVSLLFTDIVMPEMTGLQLADQARELIPDLKVLYTTGYARETIADGAVAVDAGQTLQKPYSFENLAMRIRATLDA